MVGQAPVVSDQDRKFDASFEFLFVLMTTLMGAESVVNMFFLSMKTNLLVVFIFHDRSRSCPFNVDLRPYVVSSSMCNLIFA